MKEISITCGFGKIKGLCWGAGNNKKILSLHGWLDNAASFYQLAPLLSQEGYEVVAVDFPGHGRSDHRAVDHFVHFIDYVLDIQEVLAVLGWEKTILLGHSMGAAMAQMYAATHPEKIEKLIMIENVGPVPGYEPTTAATHLKKALEQWKNHSPEHKRFYTNSQQALTARLKVTPMPREILKPMVERGLKKTTKGFHWSTDKRLRLPSLFRFSEEIIQDMLSAKKPPTQLILATPFSNAMNFSSVKQRIKKLNADETIELKGHHHLHMDKAQEVFAIIKSFIKKT